MQEDFGQSSGLSKTHKFYLVYVLEATAQSIRRSDDVDCSAMNAYAK